MPPLALILAACGPPPVHHLVALHALPDGRALVLHFKAWGPDILTIDERSPDVISLVEPTGVVWSHTPELPPAARLMRQNILVDEGIVTLGILEGRASRVLALSVEDGRELWRGPPAEHPVGQHGPNVSWFAVSANGMRVDVWNDGAIWHLRGTSRTDGVVRWEETARVRPEVTAVGHRLLVQENAAARWLDAQTGAVEQASALEGPVCVVGEVAYGVQGGRLVRATMPSRDLGPAMGIAKACGTYRSDLILTSESPEGLRMIAVSPETGVQRWELAAPGFGLGPAYIGDHTSRPLSGELPRHTVFLVNTFVKGDESQLRVIDLEEGLWDWASPPRTRLTPYVRDLFHVGSAYYLVGSERVGVIDGVTGVVVSAAEMTSIKLQPEHIAGGKLWAGLPGLSPLPLPGVAAFDAVTLEPIATRDRLSDELGPLKRLLGR